MLDKSLDIYTTIQKLNFWVNKISPSAQRSSRLSPVYGTLLPFWSRPCHAKTVWVTIELGFLPRVTRLAIHPDSFEHFETIATTSRSPATLPVLWSFHPANSPDHSRIITITSIVMKRHEKRHCVTTALHGWYIFLKTKSQFSYVDVMAGSI